MNYISIPPELKVKTKVALTLLNKSENKEKRGKTILLLHVFGLSHKKLTTLQIPYQHAAVFIKPTITIPSKPTIPRRKSGSEIGDL